LLIRESLPALSPLFEYARCCAATQEQKQNMVIDFAECVAIELIDTAQ
jgi:hypothetical protein